MKLAKHQYSIMAVSIHLVRSYGLVCLLGYSLVVRKVKKKEKEKHHSFSSEPSSLWFS